MLITSDKTQNGIIALEGHAYAGKTTILNKLSDLGEYDVVKEHDVYMKNYKYPKFPFKTTKDAEDNVRVMIEIEGKRLRDAQKYLSLGRKVVMDRTLISILLFQKFLYENVPNTPNAYLFALNLSRDEMEEGELYIPSVLVMVSPASRQVFESRTNRKISIDLYKNWSSYEYMERNYERICRLYGANTCQIKTENTEDSLTASIKKIDHFINSNKFHALNSLDVFGIIEQ
jgi:uridine kinase